MVCAIWSGTSSGGAGCCTTLSAPSVLAINARSRPEVSLVDGVVDLESVECISIMSQQCMLTE